MTLFPSGEKPEADVRGSSAAAGTAEQHLAPAAEPDPAGGADGRRQRSAHPGPQGNGRNVLLRLQSWALSDLRHLLCLQMLKMLLTDVAVKSPPPTPPALRLPGEYEVQVAAHLTLEQLQAFGRDVVRCLRSLDQSEDTDS